MRACVCVGVGSVVNEDVDMGVGACMFCVTECVCFAKCNNAHAHSTK